MELQTIPLASGSPPETTGPAEIRTHLDAWLDQELENAFPASDPLPSAMT